MLTFKQAFDAARKAGNRYFSWNGNEYNTMTKEEQNSGIGDYFSKFKGNVGNEITIILNAGEDSGFAAIEAVISK